MGLNQDKYKKFDRKIRISGLFESTHLSRYEAGNQRSIHVRETEAGCYDFRIERAT